jgi:hypothetical protein
MKKLEEIYRLPINTYAGRVQDELHKMFLNLDPNEFTLFHLTTTYMPYGDRSYEERDLSKFFTKFHLKTLLPELFHTRSWTDAKKLQQPLVYSFLDEHALDANVFKANVHNSKLNALDVRLHHHSIIASRNCTTDFYRSKVGVNTFLEYSNIFMSTDLKECDADRFFYASKMLDKFPNYLHFGFQEVLFKPDKCWRTKARKQRQSKRFQVA